MKVITIISFLIILSSCKVKMQTRKEFRAFNKDNNIKVLPGSKLSFKYIFNKEMRIMYNKWDSVSKAGNTLFKKYPHLNDYLPSSEEEYSQWLNNEY